MYIIFLGLLRHADVGDVADLSEEHAVYTFETSAISCTSIRCNNPRTKLISITNHCESRKSVISFICEHFYSEFMISHGGRRDISDLRQTKKHKVASSSAKIISFFKQKSVGWKWKMAAAEETFAQHDAKHDLYFSFDCTSKLISHISEAKCFSARTKREAIANQTKNDHLLKMNFLRTCVKLLLYRTCEYV
jgi:hypothetical protein